MKSKKTKEIKEIKKIKERSRLTKTLMLFRNKNIFLMILFDVLFLVSASAVSYLVNLYLKGNEFINTIESGPLALLIGLSVTVLYLLLLIMIYSFFKYNILDFIEGLFAKREFNFKRIKQFYLLNITLFSSILFIILFIGMLISSLFREGYAPIVLFIAAIPIVLVAYAILNISHSIFLECKSLKEILKISWGIFNNLRIRILSLYAIDAGMLFFVLIIFYISIFLARNNMVVSFTLRNIFSLLFLIVFYFIILFNRLYFYILCRR